METVTYPYAGRHSVKNNDQARALAKHQLGKDVLISRIGWKHQDGDTVCVVEYLDPDEAVAHDRAPNARDSARRNGCSPADVHNALLEMGGVATVQDIALALDVDVQWLAVQMERPQWRLEVGAAGSFAGPATELTLDITEAVFIETAPPAPPRPFRDRPGIWLSAIARSVMRPS